MEAFAVEENAGKDQNETAADERIQALESQIETMKASVPVATVEQEEKKPSFWKRNRYCILVTLAVLIAGGITAGYFLFSRSDPTPISPPTTTGTDFPTTTAATDAPTTGGTDTTEKCNAIANGEFVPYLGITFIEQFDIAMAFSVDEDHNDTDLVEFMESLQSSMQTILAPVLVANCSTSLSNDAGAVRIRSQYTIVNAIFTAVLEDEDKSCLQWMESCIRVLAKLELDLKEREDLMALANDLSLLLQDQVLASVLSRVRPIDAEGMASVVGVSPSGLTLPTTNPTPPPTYTPSFDGWDAACSAIAQGNSVPYQDYMIQEQFGALVDVSLSVPLSDHTLLVADLEYRMQAILAPKLAGCVMTRRLQLAGNEEDESTRQLAEKSFIGNVLFALRRDEASSCDSRAPTPCIRVVAQMNLYMTDEEDELSLVNRISSLFQTESLFDDLGLYNPPFNQIEFVGLASGVSTISPTVAPTTEDLLYGPNSAEDCAAIALNETVDGQEALIVRTIFIDIDVSLTLQLSDPIEAVEEMASSMQETLGPRLADCPGDGRRLQMDGKPIERNVVGNAVFAADYRPEASCDTDSPAPCMRVHVMLNLFLKGEVETVSLTNRISSMFGQGDLTGVLGLGAPFAQILVVSFWDSPPQQWPPSSLPPTDPMLLYSANTPEECAAIALGESVPFQDAFIIKSFDVRMEVSLTLQLSDLTEVVAEMESRMQRILGPRLADCPNQRRLRVSKGGDMERKLIEDHVVGNALFAAEFQPDHICDALVPKPCIRVLVKLRLFLKGEESTLDLVNRISTMMGGGELVDTLGLTAPFNQIQLAGVTTTPAPTR